MKLPEGYRVERTEPDVWTLYGPGGEVVARFIAGNVADEEIEKEAYRHQRTEDFRELAVAVLVGLAVGLALGWGAGLERALW